MASKSKKPAQGDSANLKDDSVPKSNLPFEPASNRKKPAKKSPSPTVQAKNDSTGTETPSSSRSMAVPEVVSRRMARRMGIFCGIPTGLGVLTFVVSYLVVTNQWFKLPNVVVVLVSMGCFGLGVVGLSYGVLSASWDEERVGSWFGWEEFTVNFGRVVASWRAARQKPEA